MDKLPTLFENDNGAKTRNQNRKTINFRSRLGINILKESLHAIRSLELKILIYPTTAPKQIIIMENVVTKFPTFPNTFS